MALVLCLWPIKVTGATEYTDITGHWAEDVIKKWSEREIITGYGGKFRPDDTVTRGELSVILNRLLKYPAQSENPFNDLDQDAWYYSDMLALAYEGIIPGDPYVAKGGAPVTRQDAVFMIACAFGLEYGESNGFSDGASFADWALPYINIMVRKGFINGFPDGTFKPLQPLTRAHVMVILDNMIDVIIDKPGTYIERPAVSKNILLNCSGARLDCHSWFDNVFISPGVGSGRADIWHSTGSNVYVVGMNTKVYDMSPGTKTEHIYVRILRDYVDTRFGGGIGTSFNPFQISTEDQFMLLQGFDESESSQTYFVLTNDIQLTKPGAHIERFYGILDGSNHTVSGINIEITNGDSKNIGLFGRLFGTVRNLIVEGTISVNADISDAEDGYVDAGGICGRLDGKIEKCTSRVNVKVKNTRGVAAGGIAGYIGVNGSVKSSGTSGDVFAETVLQDNNTQNSMAGGIAGRTTGRISGASSSGSIAASGGYNSAAGGIAGTLFSDSMPQINITYHAIVEKSYATGIVLSKDALTKNDSGGIIGQSQGVSSIVRTCFSFADVKAEGNPVYFNSAGGIAGAIYEGSMLLNSYSAGNVSSSSAGNFNSPGGIVGRLRAEMKNCYSTCKVTSQVKGVLSTNQALIGSGTDEGSVVNCVDMTNTAKARFYFYNSTENGSITALSKDEVLSQRTYYDRAWDFDNVWIMNASGYPLPILQGVNEDLQKIQVLPPLLK
jgi:hypothetical protein